MKLALKIIGVALVVVVALNLLGRSAEQEVAEQLHYDKIRTATGELQKFTGSD
jgi:hypothetical protein